MRDTLERIAVFASDQQLTAVLAGLPCADHLNIDLCRNEDELAEFTGSSRYDFAFLIPPLSPEFIHHLDIHRSDIPFPLVGLFQVPLEESEPVCRIADRLVLVPDNTEALCQAFGRIVQKWQEEHEVRLLSGLAKLNACMIRKGQETGNVIDRLAETVGLLLNASCVLYNRLENNMLYTAGSWNLPTSVTRKSPAQGHICFDVITRSNEKTLEIHDLQQTVYAETDPTIMTTGISTYIGRAVWCNGKPVGSLCAVDEKERSFSTTDSILLEVAALLVGTREELHKKNPLTDADRFRVLFENAPEGLYLCSADGSFLEANRKLLEILGYPDKETLLSGNIRDIARDPRDRDNWVANAIRKEAEQQSTYVARRYDGSIIWVEDTGHAVSDENGDLQYFEGSMSDITRRVEMEETLRQSQKMDAVGRLAGGFAHEFNNLLTVINGYSELIYTSLQDQDINKDRIKSVMQAGNRAAELVDMLLAFSRKQMIHPVYLELPSIMEEMTPILRHLAGASIQIEQSCAPDLPGIKADREQIQQLIINLSMNAISAVRDSGPENESHIQLTCDRITLTEPLETVGGQVGPGPFVRFEVADNGIGIPQDMMDLIFEPFFTTREIGEGAGLGLAAVHGIVNQNGAGITVTSRPGQGSTFTVYWPVPESVDA